MKKIKSAPKVKSPLQKEIFKIKQDWIVRNVVKESIDWPRQMKILGSMMELVNNLDFWKTFNLYKPFDNLYWFLKEGGKSYILKEFEKWLKNQQINKLILEEKRIPSYNLGEKVGEDYQIAAKPKTLQDFLK